MKISVEIEIEMEIEIKIEIEIESGTPRQAAYTLLAALGRLKR